MSPTSQTGRAKISASQKARTAWGDKLPVWVTVLARECDRQGVRRISAVLEYSPAVISQVINAKYNGDLKRVQTTVEGRLMNTTVTCPVMGPGDLWVDMCLKHQADARRGVLDRFTRNCLGGCANSQVSEEDVSC